MEIWLDSADINCIKEARRLGVLHGVTTNPSLIARTTSPFDPNRILDVVEYPLAIQVIAQDAKVIIEEAEKLFGYSPHIIVKIPATKEGLIATKALSQKGFPVLATAIFEPRQAFLAFKAGAAYLAPYLGRIADEQMNPFEVLKDIQEIKTHGGFQGKIMAAGIRTLADAVACLKMGLAAMTLSEKIFLEFVEDPQPTLRSVEKFTVDWKNAPQHHGLFKGM